ncbi:hypothetical protein MMC12_006259 [Toensbergia leucococca]|nr:hypothetical protein [Toensbergia leucococca]
MSLSTTSTSRQSADEDEMLMQEFQPSQESSITEFLENKDLVEPSVEKTLISQSRQTAQLLFREQAANAFCIALNTLSTVALVFLNKMCVPVSQSSNEEYLYHDSIFEDAQLAHMQISFAMWHFTCTALVLWIACHRPFHLFEPVQLPVPQMIPLCGFFAGFLVLGNWSLALNSIAFYQLTRIMTTPCVVLINFILYRKTIKIFVALSLLAVCLGVALTNGSGGSNPLGVAVAVLSFVITALYQVWIGKKLQDFQVSSSQLLMNQAPIAVILLAITVPFFDTFHNLSAVPLKTLVALFFSGVVASVLNLSQFLIIGRTSALTFNVASNLKTVIILTLSWLTEGRVLTAHDFAGMVLAVGGAMMYSQLSQ